MENAQLDLLVIAAQNGNAKAFSVLFKTFNKSLLQMAFKICTDDYMANEAVQEAWIYCSKSLIKLQDPRAFKSWLYRNTRWKALDQLRKKSKKDLFVDDMDSIVDSTSEIEQLASSEQEEPNLRKYINQLPDIERQALHLFYLDEMKISEIAFILEIPVGTVKSRLNRARKILKKQLISGHK